MPSSAHKNKNPIKYPYHLTAYHRKLDGLLEGDSKTTYLTSKLQLELPEYTKWCKMHPLNFSFHRQHIKSNVLKKITDFRSAEG